MFDKDKSKEGQEEEEVKRKHIERFYKLLYILMNELFEYAPKSGHVKMPYNILFGLIHDKRDSVLLKGTDQKTGRKVYLYNTRIIGKMFAGVSVYNATKAAIRSFARSWTVDLKHRKIRVNAVSPGPIATPMFSSRGMGLTEEQVEQFKTSVVNAVPLGRMGNPDEVAKAVAFLASDDSSYITGIELFVDGGIAQI